MKPQIFLNLLNSDLRRPRGDGLTTKLADLAKELKYKFVVGKQQLPHTQNVDRINGSSSNLEGMHCGFIWDHFAVHIACSEMDRAYDKLNKENEKLKENYKNMRASKIEWVNRCGDKDDEIQRITDLLNKANEEIKKLKEGENPDA